MLALFCVIVVVVMQGNITDGRKHYGMYVWTTGFDHSVPDCGLNEFMKWDSHGNCFTHAWNSPEKRRWLWSTCNVAGREIDAIFVSDMHHNLKRAFDHADCSSSDIAEVKALLTEGHSQVPNLKIYGLYAVSDIAVSEKDLVKYIVHYNDVCAASPEEQLDGVAVNNEAYASIKCGHITDRVKYLAGLQEIATEAAKQIHGKLLTHYSMSWHWGRCGHGNSSMMWNGKNAIANHHMIDIFDSTDVQVGYIIQPQIADRMDIAGIGYAQSLNKPIFTTAYTNEASPCQISFFPDDTCKVHGHTEAGMYATFDSFASHGIDYARPCIHYFRGIYSTGVHTDWPVHDQIQDSCELGTYPDCHHWGTCSRSCGGGRKSRICELCLFHEEKRFHGDCNEFCLHDHPYSGGSCHCPPWRTGTCCEACQHINIPHCISGQQSCGGTPDGIKCTQCQDPYYSAGYNKGCRECRNGTYGERCGSSCSTHCMNTNCNKTNGFCFGECKAGYTGDTCDQECRNGTYGERCGSSCSTHCMNANCNKTNGFCFGECKAGYTGGTCDQECRNGTYGERCGSSCSTHCMNTNCNKTNGFCFGECKAGYTGDTCDQECRNGTYGERCGSSCSTHCMNTNCNKTNGFCFGECKAGYTGDTCDQECDIGKYGINCAGNCGFCTVHTTCDPETGICPSGCMDGYTSATCNQDIDQSLQSNTVGIIAGSIVAGVVVICATIIVVCVVKYRRRQSPPGMTEPANRGEMSHDPTPASYADLHQNEYMNDKEESHYETINPE